MTARCDTTLERTAGTAHRWDAAGYLATNYARGEHTTRRGRVHHERIQRGDREQ